MLRTFQMTLVDRVHYEISFVSSNGLPRVPPITTFVLELVRVIVMLNKRWYLVMNQNGLEAMDRWYIASYIIGIITGPGISAGDMHFVFKYKPQT